MTAGGEGSTVGGSRAGAAGLRRHPEFGSEAVGVVLESDRFARGTPVYAECHDPTCRPAR